MYRIRFSANEYAEYLQSQHLLFLLLMFAVFLVFYFVTQPLWAKDNLSKGSKI